MIDEMLKLARTWRPLARLEVMTEPQGAEPPPVVVVKLGDARRRWKRVATQLTGLQVIAARGFDAKGELIGSWTAPLDDGIDDESDDAETDDQAAHRHHTQWVLKEIGKLYENQTKLTAELVGAVVDIIKALRTSIATPQQPTQEVTDDATRVLGQLLTAAMANHNRSTNAAEEIADEGGDGSDATVQGQSAQRSEASQG